MKLIGHKTESMFRRYAITNEADLSDGLAKLALLHAKDHETAPTMVPLTSLTSAGKGATPNLTLEASSLTLALTGRRQRIAAS
jgi:hypothetical protein